MRNKLVRLFDQLEDRVRSRLSNYPVIYAFIGGTCMILFWRGIWIMADDIFAPDFTSGLIWVVISSLIMLVTGIFVTSFIGDRIIITGLKGEKKDIEKTKDELEEEEDMLAKILREVRNLKREVNELKK